MTKSRRTGWVEHMVHMGKMKAYQILVRKPEGPILLGRPRHGREDNLRMDLMEIGWGGCVDYMHVA
jgi:hypothetical protein